MATKKATTKKGGAGRERAEGSGQLERVTHTLTLRLSVETDPSVNAELFGQWKRDAEQIARILESPDCPDVLRTLVGRVVTEQLLDKSNIDLAEPNALRVLYPLALADLQGHAPATAEGVTDTLHSILHHLTPGTLYSEAGEAAREMYIAELARKGAGRGE